MNEPADQGGDSALHEAIIGSLRHAYFRTSVEGTVLEVNEAFCELVDAGRDEIIGALPPHPWWPDDPDSRAEATARLEELQRGETDGLELVGAIVRRDGSRAQVSASIRVLRAPDGTVGGFVGTLEDVSARVADEERAEGLARLTDLLSQSYEEDEVLDVILDGVLEAVGCRGAGLLLPTADGASILPRRHRDLGWGDDEPPLPLEADLPVTRAFRKGEAFFFRDRKEMERRFPDAAPLANAHDDHARASLPLRGRRAPAAVLHLLFGDRRSFDTDDRAFLRQVADRCGLALERASLYEDQRRDTVRAERLQQAFAAMAAATTPSDVARIALRQAIPAVGGRAGSLSLLDDDRTSLRIVAFEGFDAPSMHGWDVMPVDAILPGTEAVRDRAGVYLEDRAAIAARFPQQVAISQRVGDQAWAALPLMVGVSAIGVLFVNFADAQPFEAPQRLALETMADRTAWAIDRARRAAHEHDVAAALQHSLLPRVADRQQVRIATRYAAGAEGLDVGGDWYDAIDLPDGRIAFSVGDVVGRGLEAAATMGHLRSALDALALMGDGPAAVLEGLDAFARASIGTHMATVAYAELRPEDGTLEYACAGHPPPVLLPARGPARSLDGGRSPLLEAMSDARPRAVAVEHLGPGDSLVLYTDGLTERRGEPPDAGIARVLQVLGDADDRDPDALSDLLLAQVAQPGGRDDIAILCACLRIPGSAIVTIDPAPSDLAELRRRLDAWLRERSIPAALRADLILAVSEAGANAVEHAYRDGRDGPISIEGEVDAEAVVVSVSDHGTWRHGDGDPARGRGMHIMRSLVDDLEVVRRSDGTTIRLRAELRRDAPA